MNIKSLIISNSITANKANNVAVNNATKTSSFTTLIKNLLEEKSLTVPELSGLHSLEDKDNNVLSIEHENHIHKYCSLCGSMLESDGSCPICIVPTIRCGNSRAENLAIENQAIPQAGSTHEKMSSLISSQSRKSKK